MPLTLQTTDDVAQIGPDIWVDAQIGRNGKPAVSIIAPRHIHIHRVPRAEAPEPFCRGEDNRKDRQHGHDRPA